MKQSPRIGPATRRLLLPLIIGLSLLLAAFTFFYVTYLQRTQLDDINLTDSEHLITTLRYLHDEQIRALNALIEPLVQCRDTLDALKTSDPDRLLAHHRNLAKTFAEIHGLAHFYFHKPDRTVLLRVDKPGREGDLINRHTLLEAERTGNISAGIELCDTGSLVLRLVRPVVDEGTLIGYLELGIDMRDMITRFDLHPQLELAVTIHKESLHRAGGKTDGLQLGHDDEWDMFPDDVLYYSSLPDFPPALKKLVGERHHVHLNPNRDIFFGERTWRVVVYPLNDVAGRTIGDLLVIHDVSSLKAANQEIIAMVTGGTFILFFLISSAIFLLLRHTDKTIHRQQSLLVESEAKYRALFKNASISVIIHDDDLNIVDCNQAALDSYGLAGLAELKAFDIFSEHSREKLDNILQRFYRDGNERFEWVSRRVDGSLFWEDVTLSRIPIDGKLYTIATAIDISERKKTEQTLKILNDQLREQSNQLRSLSLIDGLTGIANRRRFDEAFADEWRSCRRTGTSLAVLMVDIDHFKSFNDCYGHLAGDNCLQTVAEAMRARLGRAHDIIARFGGEEFICLLPDSDLDGSRAKAEELRMAVEVLGLPHEASANAAVVTVSIGVAAMIPTAEAVPEQLLNAADTALYTAKHSGRNQVCPTDNGT